MTTTSTDRAPSLPGGVTVIDCRARCIDSSGAELADSDARGLARQAETAGRLWGTRICEFLEGEPPATPVFITLRAGARLPMSKANNILLSSRLEDPAGLGALAHELVHVLAGPSPSQLLAEGIATHVDSQLQLAGPVWPFYNLAPDRWVALFRRDGVATPLSSLVGAPRMSFSSGVTSRARARGGDQRSPVITRYYLQAASYVRYLIEEFGMKQFWVCFRSGRPVPEGHAVRDLESAWLASVGGEPTRNERRTAERSQEEFAATTYPGWQEGTPP